MLNGNWQNLELPWRWASGHSCGRLSWLHSSELEVLSTVEPFPVCDPGLYEWRRAEDQKSFNSAFWWWLSCDQLLQVPAAWLLLWWAALCMWTTTNRFPLELLLSENLIEATWKETKTASLKEKTWCWWGGLVGQLFTVQVCGPSIESLAAAWMGASVAHVWAQGCGDRVREDRACWLNWWPPCSVGALSQKVRQRGLKDGQVVKATLFLADVLGSVPSTLGDHSCLQL